MRCLNQNKNKTIQTPVQFLDFRMSIFGKKLTHELQNNVSLNIEMNQSFQNFILECWVYQDCEARNNQKVFKTQILHLKFFGLRSWCKKSSL